MVRVSIPHRYAENKQGSNQKIPGEMVSIPHRYAENPSATFSRSISAEVSIPHRYAENDIRSPAGTLGKNGFNSS